MDDRSLGLAFEIDKEARRNDPLRFFEWASWAQERVAREIDRGEILVRSGNKAGKTQGAAALFVALARGERELAGVELPPIRTPNTGWIVVPSYKQAQDSVVKAYRKMLGRWPHRLIKQNTFIVGFYIKPNRPEVGEDQDNWSKILLMPDEGTEPTGGRIDWAHGDEPPSQYMWTEVRWRGESGLPFYRLLTLTPKKRINWQWIKDDFEGSLGQWNNGKLELQLSIHENRFLTPKDIAEAERQAKSEGAMGAARLRGEYIDDSGGNPFDRGKLDEWMAATRPGKPISLTVVRQSEAQKVLATCECEEWEPYDPQDVYLIVLDTGKGINDRKHDPDCLHVWSRRKRKLVFRFNGYVGGYGIGRLGGQVARRYGRAEVDPAVTGGYGEAVLSGLTDEKCTTIARNTTQTAPGKMASVLGFNESMETNNQWRGAVERALMVGDVTIPSREVVQCFLDLVVNDRGKILAGPGYHDEDWVCAGRAIERLANRPPMKKLERPARRRNIFKQLVGMTKPKGYTPKVMDAW